MDWYEKDILEENNNLSKSVKNGDFLQKSKGGTMEKS